MTFRPDTFLILSVEIRGLGSEMCILFGDLALPTSSGLSNNRKFVFPIMKKEVPGKNAKSKSCNKDILRDIQQLIVCIDFTILV